MTLKNPLPGSIRKLLSREQPLYRAHLLRLDGDARHRRFAHAVSDDFIVRYAQRAAEPGSIIFGYFTDGQLRAVAELKLTPGGSSQAAEAAFSVERDYVSQGIATELMTRVIRSARNRGVRHLILSFLPENTKMQAIARKYGADLQFRADSIVADIMPARPNFYSLANEAFDDRVGLLLAGLDYQDRRKNAA